MILLQKVLDPEDVARVLRLVAEIGWSDGKRTAGPAARPVKANRQASHDHPAMAGLQSFVGDALRRHGVFAAAARPRRLSPLLFSAYAEGDAYGPHTDDALMGTPAMRSDLAFTLFLCNTEEYEGGALTISGSAGEQSVRLAAGDAVLYDADTIHWVTPVTRGERLACVGWVESYVRDPRQRSLLFDLANARAEAARAGCPREALTLLDKVSGNLLRMWAET